MCLCYKIQVKVDNFVWKKWIISRLMNRTAANISQV